MSDRSRLLVAAAVLIGGVAVAFAITSGTCPPGRELVEDLVEPGTYRCRIQPDVVGAARSLMVLKYAVGIVSVVVAAALATSVLIRRSRASTGVA